MNDRSYQAIYDAANLNLGGASHAIACIQQEFAIAAGEMQRPSVLYRPAISIDGNQWCALYGENIQDGIAGFGDTVADAMKAFDEAWHSWNARTAYEDWQREKAANGQFGVGA